MDTYCRGERTAAAMENQLTALERKIDELLASVDQEDELDTSKTSEEKPETNGDTGKR